MTVELDGATHALLAPDDSIAIPGGMAYALADPTADLELLEITLPGKVGKTAQKFGPTRATRSE